MDKVHKEDKEPKVLKVLQDRQVDKEHKEPKVVEVQ